MTPEEFWEKWVLMNWIDAWDTFEEAKPEFLADLRKVVLRQVEEAEREVRAKEGLR